MQHTITSMVGACIGAFQHVKWRNNWNSRLNNVRVRDRSQCTHSNCVFVFCSQQTLAACSACCVRLWRYMVSSTSNMYLGIVMLWTKSHTSKIQTIIVVRGTTTVMLENIIRNKCVCIIYIWCSLCASNDKRHEKRLKSTNKCVVCVLLCALS